KLGSQFLEFGRCCVTFAQLRKSACISNARLNILWLALDVFLYFLNLLLWILLRADLEMKFVGPVHSALERNRSNSEDIVYGLNKRGGQVFSGKADKLVIALQSAEFGYPLFDK